MQNTLRDAPRAYNTYRLPYIYTYPTTYIPYIHIYDVIVVNT